MASQRNEQDSLQMSIFAIELSKGPHSPPMRKGTAFTMKLEGSSPTFLMTSGAVVEQSGATSSSRLTCKRFGESLLEEKHPINPDSQGSFKREEFCFLPFEWPWNLKLISADKLCKEGEMMMRKSTCQSFTFLGNSFTIMTWEFKNDEETYVLTGIDSDVELVASSCRGSPVVSIDDPETVVGVVACSSNGDLELFFLEANFLREIEEQLKARCPDDSGIDVTDSPLSVRGPPPSSSAPLQQNRLPEYTGTNASTSSEGLERTLSSEPVQETASCKTQAYSQEGKPGESRCIWDKLLQSVESFQDLMSDLKLHLDPKRQLGGDCGSLASAFGKNMNYIWFMESKPSPFEQLIKDCRPTLRELKNALNSNMVKRRDVSDIVENWVEKEGCECQECCCIR